jgi:UDP-N-acetylglucosamine 2-epimerase (non-hydrolysing)
MKRVMLVYGTRPEAIKMAPLIKALDEHEDLAPFAVVTGQHREMLDQVNQLFDIKPEHDLDLMVHGAALTDIAARAVAAVGDVIRRESPDAVVVQGDTTSAMAAALAAFYSQVPVVHLEAGLRTGNMSAPFPEEANRRLVGALATLHLAPTETSRANLRAENVPTEAIVVTGNTVIDALLTAVSVPARFSDPVIDELVASGGRFVLVTAHRRESWHGPMVEAMSGLRSVADRHADTRFVVPMHRNPVVRDAILRSLQGAPNVILCEPMDYHEFTHAMSRAYVVLTDSGGVQEEAPSLARPVLVMRETTERPEAVAAGTVRLVGTSQASVRDSLNLLLDDERAYAKMAEAQNPYGDGHAAHRAVAAIGHMFGMGDRAPDFSPPTQAR